MTRSRIGWAFGVVAPWCLGLGLAVSVTADAGVDADIGASFSPTPIAPSSLPDDLVPAAPRAGLTHLALAGERNLPIRQARLAIGEPDDFTAPPRLDEVEPRRDLKPVILRFPEPDRTRRGDPIVGLRPTFDARLRAAGVDAYRYQALGSARRYLAFEGLLAPASVADELAAARTLFDGQAADDGGTGRATGRATGREGAGASPRAASGPSLRSGGARMRLDGSSPVVARAVAMTSATPRPFDRQIEVIHAPALVRSFGGRPDEGRSSVAQGAPERPNYAALIDPARAEREERCLAEAIYFEARSEPESGQAAVAQVVLNRVKSSLYPASICGVVYQNRHRYLRCQFTFACEGKSLRITEPEPWRRAVRIAREVLDGRTFIADVGGSTHYHANYVRPRWAKRLKKMDTIGTHIFYKLRPGQT